LPSFLFCFQNNKISSLEVDFVAFGVVATVKSILQDSTVTYETEIAACITSSDAYVVSLLLQRGLTVVSPTPQNIVDASNYFAAWMFRKKRDPQSSWIFYTDAERFLNAYIDSQVATVGSKLGIVRANSVGDDMVE
jgi:hypothetical protein